MKLHISAKASASCYFLAAILCVGQVSAKSVYVSASGNDGVSYTANGISTPWRTIEHGLYNLKAGDHLYIRGGTYTPRYPVWLGSDSSRQTKGGDPSEVLNAESGTAISPIIVENYPGEKALVDLSVITAGSGVYINLDNKSYWTFRGLTFVNSLMVFVVGEDYLTEHNTFQNLDVTASQGGDNAAAIHLWAYRADYTTISGCKIKGPGQNVHLNTGTLYVKGVNHLKILNNVLSDAPIGIYFKHRNVATSASQVDVEIAYNYITNTSRSSLEYNGNFTHIHDNIFGANTAPAHFGDANGAAGADYNVIEHNTFLAQSLDFDSAIDSTDPFPGVVGNIVVNNIFQSSLQVLRYSTLANTNSFQKNVYPNATAILTKGGTLPVSADSILGTPTYIGGTSPSAIASFLLTSASLGSKKATDGADMGASISKILAGQPIGPVAPIVTTVQ